MKVFLMQIERNPQVKRVKGNALLKIVVLPWALWFPSTGKVDTNVR